MICIYIYISICLGSWTKCLLLVKIGRSGTSRANSTGRSGTSTACVQAIQRMIRYLPRCTLSWLMKHWSKVCKTPFKSALAKKKGYFICKSTKTMRQFAIIYGLRVMRHIFFQPGRQRVFWHANCSMLDTLPQKKTLARTKTYQYILMNMSIIW